MQGIVKFFRQLLLNFQIIFDFLKTLGKYKLWWSIPILTLILILMVFLFVAGNTGIAAFTYPLF